MRRPMQKNIENLYAFHEKKYGFPGMLGSIDCTHWPWKNCPTTWRGQFMCGDIGAPSIILESICSQDLWIWHAFFGVAGSNNDLNVLVKSFIFDEIIRGTGPDSSFMLNGVSYKHGYYLADGIYPPYTAIVKTIPLTDDEKRKKFAKCQEAQEKMSNGMES
ncbi:putative harbinger transposase-derived protein [Helianthus annuus]|nr:putative harbinger transposase-derived protein [Helianthus annuus]